MSRCGIGVLVFLCLEAVTTPVQLVDGMASASATLAGHDGATAWDYWSRFLEADGRFVLEVVTALLTIAAAGRATARGAA
jgi:hypothetical protein